MTLINGQATWNAIGPGSIVCGQSTEAILSGHQLLLLRAKDTAHIREETMCIPSQA